MCKLAIIPGLWLLLLLATTVDAQPWPSQMWHEGRVVLDTGDTLKGQLKYDLKQDLIQFNVPNQRTDAFSSRKVLFFEIYDKTERRYRQFYALPYTNAAQYRTPIFFELLTEGKMTLLVRESIEQRTYSSPYYIGSYSREVMVYHYFFLDNEGNIEEFKGSKADLLAMMGRKSDDVEKYMKANRLKIDDKYDFARIVAYYNSI
jgi:hypothetical protein